MSWSAIVTRIVVRLRYCVSLLIFSTLQSHFHAVTERNTNEIMTSQPASLLQRIKSLPFPALILAVTVILVGLMFALRPSPKINPKVDLLPFVSAIPAQPQSLRPVVTLYGRVETPRESRLSSGVNAYVKEVPVEEGKEVSAGQVLVQLDDSDLQLALAQRQAEVADIKARINSENARYQNDQKALTVEEKLLALSNKAAARYEKLVSKNVGSDLNRDEALQASQRQALSLLSREYAVQDHPNRLAQLQAQLEKAQALRDQAQLDLERARIRAPFAGRVTAVKVSPGDRVRPGDLIVSLYDTGHLEVRAQIPSRYLQDVKQAIADKVTMDATLVLDGHRVPLDLDRLSGAVAMGQGGVDALFRLRNDDKLTLGRSAELDLQLPPQNNVIALPPTALYGQNRIYAVDNGVLKTLIIDRIGETLRPDGSQWQLVRGDVPPGTLILTTQLANAVGGMAVKLKKTP